jgi:hypothetical protein
VRSYIFLYSKITCNYAGSGVLQTPIIFICGRKSFNKSRIAVVPKDIVFQCIDLNREDKYKSQEVKIRHIKGHWNFDVYGTARSDKVKGKDNTLKVRIKNIDDVFGKQEELAIW